MRPRSAILSRSNYYFDGEYFDNVEHLIKIAINRGWKGAKQTLRDRIKSGVSTWSALLKPADEKFSKGGRTSARKRDAEREEMRLLCAALDARKKSISEK